ncbi:MAG: histidine kinase [Gammaproteobacteria bacterium]|nr:histidine kinase [Gammaproteobacteria bacterium]
MLCRDLKCFTSVLFFFLFSVSSSVVADDECHSSLDALIRLAAVRIDTVFEEVSASTRALAEEFVTFSKTAPAATAEQRERWLTHYVAKDHTVAFQSWSGNPESPPDFQAPDVAFFTYNGTDFTAETFRELQLFERLTPLFRAAYRSFHLSWSYLTTPDGAMLIYPFLPLNKAVNNYPPTQQVYYTSADFKNRRAGWTSPYLDLVGAGMMITVSYPAYDGDTLLGVVSHDMTLDQLSHSVLNSLVVQEGATAYIVDDTGLVIGVTGDALIRELDEVNDKAGEAVLHYRPKAQLDQLGLKKAVPSATAWINDLTERLLAKAQANKDLAIIRVEQDGRHALATRTVEKGWYVVLVIPT